jgi:hypothetical protein
MNWPWSAPICITAMGSFAVSARSSASTGWSRSEWSTR